MDCKDLNEFIHCINALNITEYRVQNSIRTLEDEELRIRKDVENLRRWVKYHFKKLKSKRLVGINFAQKNERSLSEVLREVLTEKDYDKAKKIFVYT